MHSANTVALRHLAFIDQILRAEYGSPNHNNKRDPFEELVFIVLSQRTRAQSYETVFNALKRGLGRWENLLRIDEKRLRALIREGGMAKVKARRLKQIAAKLAEDFGRVSLKRLEKWPNARVLSYLTSLPGVGQKTAYCVMMYSLNRKVFPADANVIRVAHRLGLTRHPPVSHKQAQTELARVVPPPLAFSLHVNMLQHGRAVCKPNPKCDSCSLKKFCEFFRHGSRRGRRPTHSFLDLFCGAGGLSLGFRRTGFELVFAIDNFRHAIETFRVNHPEIPPERVLCGDIRQLKDRDLNGLVRGKEIDVVAGGPPCQGFSMAGARIRSSVNGVRYLDDGRNHMYKEFVRIVSRIRPRIFVMENVVGLASAKDGFYRRAIYRAFSRQPPRYAVREFKIDASKFGVPQARHRLWFVGVRRGRGGERAATRVLDVISAELQHQEESQTITLGEAIRGLPVIGPGEGAEVIALRGRRRTESQLVFNHVARRHHPRDRALFRLLKPGERGYEAVHKYGRPDLMPFRTDIFKDKYRRLRADTPGPTIVAHLERDAHMFIHPNQPRGLTVRESARLQTFPDDYVFLGPYGKQFRQVGNAVPPMLSWKVARAIRRGLAEMTGI